MTNKRRVISTGLALSLLAAFAFGYWVSRARAAGVPATAPLTYSGVLTDMNGTPLTGTKNILLQLYSVASAGTALCGSAPTSLTLVGGAFQVALADNCTAIVHSNSDLWVDVLVDGASIGRSKLGAVPYAIEADHAVSATSATTATTATTAQTATTIAAGPIAGGLTVYTVPGNAIAAPCAVAAGSVIDCTCPTGSFVVSGGGDGGSASGRFIRESRAITATTWRVTCSNVNADALCATYHLLCSRIGP